MSKGSAAPALILTAIAVGLFAVKGYKDAVITAVGKLKFKVSSVRIIPLSQTTPVTGIGKFTLFKDIGKFVTKGFKHVKDIFQSAATGKVGIEMKMQLINPTNTSLDAKDFRFKGQVLHAGKVLAHIDQKMPIKVSAKDTSNVYVRMSLQVNNVLNSLLDSLKGKSLNDSATITLQGNGYAMGTDFPVNQTFNLLQS